MRIGLIIDRALTRLRKTQGWLAQELGISRTTLWRMRNQGEHLDRAFLFKISEALDLDLKGLINTSTTEDERIITLNTLRYLRNQTELSKVQCESIDIVVNLIKNT